MFKNLSLNYRLNIILLLVGLLPALGIGIFSYVNNSDSLKQSIFSSIEMFGKQAKSQVDNFFDEKRGDVKAFATKNNVIKFCQMANSGVKQTDFAAYNNQKDFVEADLKTLADIYSYSSIVIVNKQGIVIAESNKEIVGKDVSVLPYLKPTLEGKTVTSEIYYGVVIKEILIAIATPIYTKSKDKTVIATLVGIIPQKGIADRVQKGVESLGKSADAFLINKKKILLTDTKTGNKDEALKKTVKTVGTEKGTEFIKDQNINSIYSGIYNNVRGEKVLGVVQALKVGDNYDAMLIEVNKDEALASIDFMRNMFIISAIIVFIIILILGIFFAGSITKPILRAVDVAKRLAKGDLTMNIEINRRDEIGTLLSSMRDIVDTSREMASISDSISKGDLDLKLTVRSDKDLLGESFNSTIETLNGLIKAMDNMHKEQTAGDYEYFIESNKFSGSFNTMAEKINNASKLHINNIMKILDVLEAYGVGDLSKQLAKQPGKLIIINERLNSVRTNLINISDEIKALVSNAMEGNLTIQGDPAKFSGVYSEIIEGINNMLTAILDPIKKAASMLLSMSDGDLTEMLEGDYKGDHTILQNAINDTLKSMNELLAQVSIAVEQTTAGADQVSSSSQALSQGASEQASSLEEITSSITEVNSQTKQNLDRIENASNLSKSTVELGSSGKIKLNELLKSMEGINTSSDKIKKITKIIDDIAFQINLLALNASVEAARAGKYGKGFAVVAEEVRNLAVRSTESVKETSSTIDESIKNLIQVNNLVEEAARHFDNISSSSEESSKFLDEIVIATREQALAIDEINRGLGQVDQVTQANTANAEESASAAEELNSQAQQLKSMIQKFKIKDSYITNIYKRTDIKFTDTNKLKNNDNVMSDEKGVTVVNPKDEINLDDDDFGNF